VFASHLEVQGTVPPRARSTVRVDSPSPTQLPATDPGPDAWMTSRGRAVGQKSSGPTTSGSDLGPTLQSRQYHPVRNDQHSSDFPNPRGPDERPQLPWFGSNPTEASSDLPLRGLSRKARLWRAWLCPARYLASRAGREPRARESRNRHVLVSCAIFALLSQRAAGFLSACVRGGHGNVESAGPRGGGDGGEHQ
jgi:hypothetical protein